MPTKKPLADPMNLAEWRQIEDLKPGHWMRVELENTKTGEVSACWAEISLVMEGTQVTTGRKIVRLYGADEEGYRFEFAQFRGFQVQRLTAAQGRRCGLAVPAESPSEDES